MGNEQKVRQVTDSNATSGGGERRDSNRKPFLTVENILKVSKGRVVRILSALVAVLVLLACINEAYDYTKRTIGDGAYKYSDEAYDYIEASIQNYLGEDGPDIAALQECIPNWTSHYENGKTTLTCIVQDGFFCAEVTSTISSDFQLENSARNFNSLQEYQDYFWHTFKLSVAKRAGGMFLVIAAVWLAVSSSVLWVLKRHVEKNARRNVDNPTVLTVDSKPTKSPAA